MTKIMTKKLIRLTESDLHRIVKESVNKVLKESLETQGIIASLEKLEDKLVDVASEIKRIFFKNERRFDDSHLQRFVRLGLDNPPYSFGTQGELSRSFDAESWKQLTKGNALPFEQELQETFKWFNTLKWYAECEGYGVGAASRGFNVTSPIGLMWTESTKAIRILEKMAEITGVKLNTADKY